MLFKTYIIYMVRLLKSTLYTSESIVDSDTWSPYGRKV